MAWAPNYSLVESPEQTISILSSSLSSGSYWETTRLIVDNL